MNQPTCSLFLLLLVLRINSAVNLDSNSRYWTFLDDQERLYNDLFANYSTKLTPIFTLNRGNASDAIPKFLVHVESSFLKLIQISDPEESATFIFDYTTSWQDPRLAWDPSDYGGIDHLYLPRSEVWVPEVAVVDCTDVRSFLPDNMRNVHITSTGQVSFYEIELVSVICEMDVYEFPMDQQTCGVNVIFFTYENDEYQINATFGTLVKPVNQLGNGEWQVLSVQMAYELTLNGTSFVSMFQANMKRNPGFYVVLVIIPAYFINALSIIALFFNIGHHEEQFQIGLTNIMSMSFIMVILSDDLPKTKNIPLLAIYVLVSLAIIIATMGTVLAIPRIKKYFMFFEKIRKFKIEYIIMIIFQLANLINFIVLFL